MYEAKILLDHLAPSGRRLTTFVITYPRIVHSEFMTHRIFSRNAASSRAIPVSKMLEAVNMDPFLPVWWGKAQPGMQAKEEIEGPAMADAIDEWLHARDMAVRSAQRLLTLGLHKQIVNRLLEPFSWITVIVTGTDFGNYFALRCHEDAQPEIKKIANMMRDLYFSQEPIKVNQRFWHLPFISFEDLEATYTWTDKTSEAEEIIKQISVARCARISYLTHEGKRDVAEDVKLFQRLKNSGHWSPFEHVACAEPLPVVSGNFVGWSQYRKMFENEFRTYHAPNSTG